jgi:hypothetical protein
MNNEKVKRDDWKTEKPPGDLKRLAIEREYTQEEYEEMLLGFKPQVMEDKWFIYSEDDWLYFYRSWTGKFYGKVRLEKKGDRFVISEAWVSNLNDLGKDASRILEYLIDRILLGREIKMLYSDPLVNFGYFGRHRSRREPAIEPFTIELSDKSAESDNDQNNR